MKDILHTPAYEAFSSKSAGKVVDEANNLEFLSVENALKEVWLELDGLRWYNMTTTEGYGIINVSCLTATRIIYFVRRQLKSLLNFKFYADIGVGIPYLVASVATMFEHVNCVGIDLPETIESIKHIMKYTTNGKCQILNSISFVSQDILKCKERFLTDLKKCQVITNFIGLPLIDEYVIQHVLPGSSCKVVMFRVANRTFPKVHKQWLLGLGFKAIKTFKGTLAIQSEPEYSNFEVRVYVFNEDPNVFVPQFPTNRNGAVGFGSETGVPRPDDLKSFIISDDKRAAEDVSEHFEKVNAFRNRNKVPVPESTDIISRIKRELPALLEDEATFHVLKKAFQESLNSRITQNTDGSCILCGYKTETVKSGNISHDNQGEDDGKMEEYSLVEVSDEANLSRNNSLEATGSSENGDRVETNVESEWTEDFVNILSEVKSTKETSQVVMDVDRTTVMPNVTELDEDIKLKAAAISNERMGRELEAIESQADLVIDSTNDMPIINEYISETIAMEIVRVDTENLRLSLDCTSFAPNGIEATNADAIDKYVDEGLIKVKVTLKYSGRDFQENVCKGDESCALHLVDVYC